MFNLLSCILSCYVLRAAGQDPASGWILKKMGKNEDTAVNLKYDEKLYLAARKIAESDSNE